MGGSPNALRPLTLLKLASCPQVECNSKLDPTTTTFLKVRRSSPPQAQPPGGACLESPPGGGDSVTGRGGGGVRGPLLSSPPSLPLQMADSGGLPQVTQVRLLALPPSLPWPGVGGVSSLPESQAASQSPCLSLRPLPQPGKLTEAFKYFLQGMGYSKYASSVPRPGTGGQEGLSSLGA